jgi:hypothetical protein
VLSTLHFAQRGGPGYGLPGASQYARYAGSEALQIPQRQVGLAMSVVKLLGTRKCGHLRLEGWELAAIFSKLTQ